MLYHIFCLFVFPSFCLSIYMFICQYVYLSICLSFYLSIRLSVYTSIRLSVYLCICLSLNLSICLSVCLFVCLSVRLSVRLLSVCLSVFCPSVCPSFCLSVCLSICPFIFLYFWQSNFIIRCFKISKQFGELSTNEKIFTAQATWVYNLNNCNLFYDLMTFISSGKYYTESFLENIHPLFTTGHKPLPNLQHPPPTLSLTPMAQTQFSHTCLLYMDNGHLYIFYLFIYLNK